MKTYFLLFLGMTYGQISALSYAQSGGNGTVAALECVVLENTRQFFLRNGTTKEEKCKAPNCTSLTFTPTRSDGWEIKELEYKQVKIKVDPENGVPTFSETIIDRRTGKLLINLRVGKGRDVSALGYVEGVCERKIMKRKF